MNAPMSRFFAVIPAGGAGTRLWPLSRRAVPKFLMPIGGGTCLLARTVDRCRAITGDDGVLIVTGRPHVDGVLDAVPSVPARRVVAEPSPRDSMPAIAMAAALVEREDRDAVIGSFPADHVIADPAAFERAVTTARLAAEQDLMATIGITPDSPSSGFGYIEPAATLEGVPGAFRAARFVEKPDPLTAAEYVQQGYLWNAGMFVVRARVLLDALAEQIPALAAGVREAASCWDQPDRQEELERIWPTLTKIAIDYALAEPLAASGRVAVVPASMGWDDLGDVVSLARNSAMPVVDGSRVEGGRAFLGIDAHVTVFSRTDRVVAAVGVEDVTILDTDEAIVVVADSHAQDLKKVADRARSEVDETLA